MSNKVLEKLTPVSLTKYGFQIDGGEYINWSKKLPESEQGKVVPGVEYEFELFVADSGKRYVNEVHVLAVLNAGSKPPKLLRSKELTPAKDNDTTRMSKEEWQAKDTRISRQGAIQAAVQATGGNFEAALELAIKMLEFVTEKH